MNFLVLSRKPVKGSCPIFAPYAENDGKDCCVGPMSSYPNLLPDDANCNSCSVEKCSDFSGTATQ